ncbi:conserved hypothetical protein [Burkholderia pseudomallei 576]|nr:conserved hypothetical protein [Burkholderia pseudomallei 576]
MQHSARLRVRHDSRAGAIFDTPRSKPPRSVYRSRSRRSDPPPARARTADDGTCAASRERAVSGVRTGATGMPTGSTNARSIHAQARNGHASIG